MTAPTGPRTTTATALSSNNEEEDVSEEHLPFTKEERESIRESAKAIIEDRGRQKGALAVFVVLDGKRDLRFLATLRAVEAKRDALRAERDAAMVFASHWIDGGDHRAEAAAIRETLARQGYSQMSAAEWAGIAAALEALPDDVPEIDDAIEAVYSHLPEAL